MNWVVFFTYAPYVFWALTCLAFVRRSGLRIWHQAQWAMFLLLCFSKFFLFGRIGGSSFYPDLPERVIWAWDWAYSGAVFLMGLSLLFPFRFRRKALLLPLAAWGIAAWGIWCGLRLPDVKAVDLEFANLPPALEGYRLVQISDLHCSSAARRWRTQAVVDLANALKPDLICLTGDFADGRCKTCRDFLLPLGELRARDGVFACTGNHEYYSGYSEWMQFYSTVPNLRFLTNACVFPHEGLAVAGVPDVAGKRYRLDACPDVRAAFAAATNGEFRILLQHQPKDAAANIREVGVDLQLSGHTHGGIAPIMRQVAKWHNGGVLRGIYRFGGSVLYVCSGCGQWAGFPIRLFSPSEITLITLRRGHF